MGTSPYIPEPRVQIILLDATFGPYVGKTLGLYLSKNSKKLELKTIDLRKFYSDIEKVLISKIGNKVLWRTNILVNTKSREPEEVELIPMAFRGDFLLKVLKRCEVPPIDMFGLIHAAVISVGELFHEAISDNGYLSTFPKIMKDMKKESLKQVEKEIEKADFHIDLRFAEKNLFTSTESDLIDKYSESSLERRIGFELIKEAIPILIQYEIKSDFPIQKSLVTIAKPDFIVLDPLKPVAVFCDSYQYHQRKKDQIFKDRRIDRKLQKKGFAVFRFSEEEINKNLEGCIEEIKEYYFGKEFALSTNEVFMKKLAGIDHAMLSEWEKRFVETLIARLNEGKNISLKEEKILYQILDKRTSQD